MRGSLPPKVPGPAHRSPGRCSATVGRYEKAVDVAQKTAEG
jgi:hypothetical protein